MVNIRELFNKGHDLHNSGELSAASALYLKILDIQPNHVDTVFLLGTLYLQQGEFDLATAFLKKTIVLKPEYMMAYNNLGATLRAQGRLYDAIKYCKQATVINPNDAESHNNLGAMFQESGKFDEAIERHKKAIMLKPEFAGAYSNLGTAFEAQGKLEDAIASHKRAIELENDNAEAHNNLGTAFHEQGKLDDAEACYRRAIALKLDYADPHYNLGNMLKEKGKINEAVKCFRLATIIRQDYFEAYNNLGKALKEQGKLTESLAICKKAIEIKPDNAIGYNNLGTVLQELGKLEEAVKNYSRAIELEPNNAVGYSNLGGAVLNQGNHEKAAKYCTHAIKLRPDCTNAHNNQGVILQSQGKLVGAIESYNRAITNGDDNTRVQAHINRSHALLLTGNFEQGWPEYEWRLHAKDYVSRTFRKPRWDGLPLNGKSVLVHAEQGYGDTIQFVRYLPLIHERGGYVVFECQKHLCRLLRNCAGIDEIIERDPACGPSHQFDVHIPLLSLPGVFGTTLATIPSDVPYITIDHEFVNQWQLRLNHDDNLRVGILWAGNLEHKNDHNRSCSLTDFAPLADIPGITFYSLQKERATVEVHNPPEGMKIVDLKDELNDFTDTAAVISNMDLVISVDTSVVHLAGAIASPVWNLVPFAPDFRWLLKRDDSPWYPGMRLFRQTQPNDWSGVFKRVKKALANLCYRKQKLINNKSEKMSTNLRLAKA